MKKLSKLVSLMLSVVLCIGMASPALAVTYDISLGDVTVTESGSTGWLEGATEASKSADKDITITQRDSETATKNTITVGEGVTDTTITLKDVNIDVSSGYKAALSVTGTGEESDKTHVTINLEGENTLKSGDGHAGLELDEGASVTIQSDLDKNGSLTATGGSGGAGIGGGQSGTAGDITITGNAQVTATGAGGGAGIGGGYGGKVGDIKIDGDATVTAKNESYGVGIGSGAYGMAADIIISGNTVVEAYGGNDSAGIGTRRGEVNSIRISGNATVTAKGGQNGAGIGTGAQESNSSGGVGSITIEGAKKIIAEGGQNGAGIGSGRSGKVDSITIEGAKEITAKGGEAGAGIGGGYGSTVGNITINVKDSEKITATGGNAPEDIEGTNGGVTSGSGAGIGGGYCDKVGAITVSGTSNLSAIKGGNDAKQNIGVGCYSTVGKVSVQLLREDGTLLYQKGSSEYVYSLPDDQKFTADMIKEGGSIYLPPKAIEKGPYGVTFYPEGTTLDQDGNASVNSPSVTQGSNKVTINDGNGSTSTFSKNSRTGTVTVTANKEQKITAPKGSQIKVDENYVVTVVVPAGYSVTGVSNEKKDYPNGAIIDKDCNIISTEVTSNNEDGTVTVTTKTEKSDGTASTVQTAVKILEGAGEITSTPESITTLPGGSVVVGTDSETTYPNGTTLDKAGKADPASPSVTKNKDGSVTIDDGKGSTITVTVPEGSSESVVVNPDGSVDGLPAGTVVTDKEGKETRYPNGGSISADGTLKPNDPPAPVDPVDPVGPDTPVIPDSDTGVDVAPATIADQEVPLAGLVSRQILVSALYVHEGSPDGEDAEGEYTKALAWAVANGIIDQDTDPEEVVTVAILRDVMTRYARFLDVIFDVEIPGEDDEIVMNCDEILEKFFASQEDKAA